GNPKGRVAAATAANYGSAGESRAVDLFYFGQFDSGECRDRSGGERWFRGGRRDWDFGPGTDSDLVLRSPGDNFNLPRESAMERYYVRKYDGSTPPNYSRFSNAVIVNVAL